MMESVLFSSCNQALSFSSRVPQCSIFYLIDLNKCHQRAKLLCLFCCLTVNVLRFSRFSDLQVCSFTASSLILFLDFFTPCTLLRCLPVRLPRFENEYDSIVLGFPNLMTMASTQTQTQASHASFAAEGSPRLTRRTSSRHSQQKPWQQHSAHRRPSFRSAGSRSRVRHDPEEEERLSRQASRQTAGSGASRRRQPKWWKIRLFRGMIDDVKRRAPFYWSDWTDAWDYRVVPATVYM